MPLSLVALIIVAVFVWMGRGDFSTRDVTLTIEGPAQIENGQSETFELVVDNNSSNAIGDINVAIEAPTSLSVAESRNDIAARFGAIDAGQSKRVSFTVVASSSKPTETIKARLDYSPQGVSARFVTLTQFEVVIGKLDATLVLDLPSNIFAEQEIKGAVHVVANSDIATEPLYLRLNTPEPFSVEETSHPFEFGTVWKVGKLQEGQEVKREFRGMLASAAGDKTFSASLGRLDGISFLAMNTTEKTLQISESPLVLNQEADKEVVYAGDSVDVTISFVNKAEVPLENAVLRTTLPVDLVDFDSVTAPGARIDNAEGSVEWNKTTSEALRFSDVDEGGTFSLQFDINETIVPENALDTNKIINVATTLKSEEDTLELNGARLQTEDTRTLQVGTDMRVEQDVFRENDAEGPHPPEAGETSTYRVRWTLTNTTNKVRNGRVEAVLPSYVDWRGVAVGGEAKNMRHISETNTVVWDLGDVDAGVGYVFSEREVEFEVTLAPDEEDIQGGVNVLEQTKLSGTDTFTGRIVEQDIGETAPTN